MLFCTSAYFWLHNIYCFPEISPCPTIFESKPNIPRGSLGVEQVEVQQDKWQLRLLRHQRMQASLWFSKTSAPSVSWPIVCPLVSLEWMYTSMMTSLVWTSRLYHNLYRCHGEKNGQTGWDEGHMNVQYDIYHDHVGTLFSCRRKRLRSLAHPGLMSSSIASKGKECMGMKASLLDTKTSIKRHILLELLPLTLTTLFVLNPSHAIRIHGWSSFRSAKRKP